MDSYVIDYRKKVRNYGIVCAFFIFLIMVFLTILSLPPVQAYSNDNVTINFTKATSSSVTWEIIYEHPENIEGFLIDGNEIVSISKKFDSNYTYSDLEPDSLHELCIYDNATIACESGNTTSENKKSDEQLTDFLVKWVYLFITLILIVIGIRIPFVGIMAFVFSFIGFIYSVMLSGDYLLDIVYMLGMIATVYVTYQGMKQ